jgi:hypothetical protein
VFLIISNNEVDLKLKAPVMIRNGETHGRKVHYCPASPEARERKE